MKQYIIQTSDVGKDSNSVIGVSCPQCKKSKTIKPFTQLVQRQDVGKICKLIGGLWYIESPIQFTKRITNGS